MKVWPDNDDDDYGDDYSDGDDNDDDYDDDQGDDYDGDDDDCTSVQTNTSFYKTSHFMFFAPRNSWLFWKSAFLCDRFMI